jgi:hypothetical protein
VSPRVVLPFVILTNDPPLQPPADVDDTRNVVAPPIFEFFDTSASREARPAQREVLTSPSPISTSPMQLTEQLRPVISQPLSRDVLPSQVLRDTGSNIPLGPPELGERREENESSFRQVDPPRERTMIRFDHTSSVQPSVKPFASPPPPFSSHERDTIRPHAEQVLRTASIQPTVKPSTPPPPPSKRPSVSTSPLPSPPAPKMKSSRLHMPNFSEPLVDKRRLSNSSTSIIGGGGYEPITAQPSPLELNHPRRGSSGKGEAPRRGDKAVWMGLESSSEIMAPSSICEPPGGGPPEQPWRRESIQLSSSDDEPTRRDNPPEAPPQISGLEGEDTYDCCLCCKRCWSLC